MDPVPGQSPLGRITCSLNLLEGAEAERRAETQVAGTVPDLTVTEVEEAKEFKMGRSYCRCLESDLHPSITL